MKNIICILHTCIYSTHDKQNINNRIQQYVNGINKFFEKNELYLNNNIDIVLIDNNIKNYEDIPLIIRETIPDNVKVITSLNNSNGAHNKGAGLIDNWKSCYNIIEKYKWLIHFEPRQLLFNHDFIINFIENPRNLFNINKPHNNHFNTGLFCIKTEHLLHYIDNIDINTMIKNKISIEYSLYDYFKYNNIEYNHLDSLNLQWHDSYTNKYLKI